MGEKISKAKNDNGRESTSWGKKGREKIRREEQEGGSCKTIPSGGKTNQRKTRRQGAVKSRGGRLLRGEAGPRTGRVSKKIRGVGEDGSDSRWGHGARRSPEKRGCEEKQRGKKVGKGIVGRGRDSRGRKGLKAGERTVNSWKGYGGSETKSAAIWERQRKNTRTSHRT